MIVKINVKKLLSDGDDPKDVIEVIKRFSLVKEVIFLEKDKTFGIVFYDHPDLTPDYIFMVGVSLGAELTSLVYGNLIDTVKK